MSCPECEAAHKALATERLKTAAAQARVVELKAALQGVADVLENARRAVSKGSGDYLGAFIATQVDTSVLSRPDDLEALRELLGRLAVRLVLRGEDGT